MPKLYFKYGAMGSSKTAQALITKYNYEERGLKVWLLKPSADTRDGDAVLTAEEAAQAAADGDPGQLMRMMDRLLNTREGAELVERISRQAKESGLS